MDENLTPQNDSGNNIENTENPEPEKSKFPREAKIGIIALIAFIVLAFLLAFILTNTKERDLKKRAEHLNTLLEEAGAYTYTEEEQKQHERAMDSILEKRTKGNPKLTDSETKKREEALSALMDEIKDANTD